jgi:hypothetical protein
MPVAYAVRDPRAEVDQPSRTRAFIAISLGLTPPACAIQSITFLSDTLCWVEVNQLDRDRIGEILQDELLLADALQPEGGGVHGRLGVDSNRVVDVADIPKRHPAFAEGHGERIPDSSFVRPW